MRLIESTDSRVNNKLEYLVISLFITLLYYVRIIIVLISYIGSYYKKVLIVESSTNNEIVGK